MPFRTGVGGRPMKFHKGRNTFKLARLFAKGQEVIPPGCRQVSFIARRKICTAIMDLDPPTYTGQKPINLYILSKKKYPPLGTFNMKTVGPPGPGPGPWGGASMAPKGQFRTDWDTRGPFFHNLKGPVAQSFSTMAKVKTRRPRRQAQSIVDSVMTPAAAKLVQEQHDMKRKSLDLAGKKTFDDKSVEGLSLWKADEKNAAIACATRTSTMEGRRLIEKSWQLATGVEHNKSILLDSSRKELVASCISNGNIDNVASKPLTPDHHTSCVAESSGACFASQSIPAKEPSAGDNSKPIAVKNNKKKRTRKSTVSQESANELSEKKNGAEETSNQDTGKSQSSVPDKEEPVEPLMAEAPPDVQIVMNAKQAKEAMKKLEKFARSPDRIFACDTEVMNIEVTSESPCGHGDVICFSVYCGDDADFAIGKKTASQKSHLWVDLLDRSAFEAGEANYLRVDILEEFRDFFENPSFKKCWHNYGFDRHVLGNPPFNINCAGFAGDTMHMARLWDSSRKIKGYSLAALSSDTELMGENASDSQKTTMKAIFGYKKLRKDGTEGKLSTMDPIEQLHLSDRTRNMWIHYSARDAKATYDLRQQLRKRLDDRDAMKCLINSSLSDSYGKVETMWDFYTQVWLPFGELLTEMEKDGFYVDVEHLAAAEKAAIRDRAKASDRFRNWAMQRVPDAKFMNVNSDIQVRTLLFAGVTNEKNKQSVEMTKTFKCPNPLYAEHIAKNLPGKKPLKNMEYTLHGLWGEDVQSNLTPPITTASGWPATSSPALKALVGRPGAAQKLLEEEYGVSDVHSVADILEDEDQLVVNDKSSYATMFKEAMVANENGIGKIYSAFGGGQKGLEACAAVEALLEVNSIDTLLSSFILPLQEDNMKTDNGRIHASLNINTETGRLSCRRPNLQNQPALEKDRYKVRKGFMADRRNGKNNTLIVADYGQLELRVLAHLTNCKSMIEAFKSGGDFHSRTALGMYDYIKEAVDSGKCVLEREEGNTDSAIPLLKDVYATERRKAKVLNFSLAYGKTSYGLSKDWGVSKEEAEETLRKWYSDRQEVKKWQERTIARARKEENGHYVNTLLGRRRNLPNITSSNPRLRAHSERAAINTPVQGSAADIAAAAMLCIRENEDLKKMGWKLLLQVHDEVILEGPEDCAEEAKSIVIQCLQEPFPAPGGKYHNPLLVDLTVDCNIAHTWYEAK